jgi:hypothetical protein
VIAEPPVAGAVKAMLAELLLGVATNAVGASGTVYGVTAGVVAAEAELSPAAFVAVIINV